jgi:hypothetical protein
MFAGVGSSSCRRWRRIASTRRDDGRRGRGGGGGVNSFVGAAGRLCPKRGWSGSAVGIPRPPCLGARRPVRTPRRIPDPRRAQSRRESIDAPQRLPPLVPSHLPIIRQRRAAGAEAGLRPGRVESYGPRDARVVIAEVRGLVGPRRPPAGGPRPDAAALAAAAPPPPPRRVHSRRLRRRRRRPGRRIRGRRRERRSRSR